MVNLLRHYWEADPSSGVKMQEKLVFFLGFSYHLVFNLADLIFVACLTFPKCLWWAAWAFWAQELLKRTKLSSINLSVIKRTAISRNTSMSASVIENSCYDEALKENVPDEAIFKKGSFSLFRNFLNQILGSESKR